MGDISNKNFELTDSAKLKMSLLDDLRNNPNKKQIIKLKGNSSLLFANLTALTLASCGGGGGGSPAHRTPPANGHRRPHTNRTRALDGTLL